MKQHHTALLCLLALSASVPAHAEPSAQAEMAEGVEAAKNAAKPIRINLKPQAWQLSRQEFALAANTLRKNPNDDKARNKLDQIVARFDKNPIGQTPLESMEILGAVHLHREGILKAMPLIVMEAVFGWYDALQWGSETARNEIEKSEQLFTRALVIGGGNKAVNDWADLLEKQPETAIRIVDDGIARATKLHAGDKKAYDHKWPTAYSLERTLAAMRGQPEPKVTQSNMSSDKAWKAAIEKVRGVYIPRE
jgi:hypothetical protein